MNHESSVLLFLHIPKTGGVSLQNIIQRYYDRDEMLIVKKKDLPLINQMSESSKKELKCISGHMIFGLHNDLPSPCKYITILRDPIDRIISTYYHALQCKGSKLYDIIVSDNLGFDEYVKQNLQFLYNLQTFMICGGYDGLKKKLDIKDLKGFRPNIPPESLNIAIENIKKHFILTGTMDRFDESLLILKELMGWHNVYYFKDNISTKRPSHIILDRKTKDILLERNSIDLRLLKYANEQLDTQIDNYGPSFYRDLRSFRRHNKLQIYWNKYYTKLKRKLINRR